MSHLRAYWFELAGSPTAAIPPPVLAVNLLAPLTQANTSAGSSTPWYQNFEQGATATYEWLAKGVKITRTSPPASVFAIQLWNQQRHVLATNTRYRLYLVAKAVGATNTDYLDIRSEARDAGYGGLGLEAELILSEVYQLYTVEFTTSGYNDGQLNTLPAFFLGTVQFIVYIKDIALIKI